MEAYKLKDILYLYLGCEVFGTYNDQSGSKGYLTGITNGGQDCEIQFFEEDGINVSEEPEFNDLAEIKPILRPLSDMTEDECKTIGLEKIYKEITSKEISGQGFVWKSGEIIHLLKWGFDLFGLIESNQAVNKLTL